MRDAVAPIIAAEANRLDAERTGQRRYLEFVRQHKQICRIIDEAEFVDPASYRRHYTQTAARIAAGLEADVACGEISAGSTEIRAWALTGMIVFLGLRSGVWGTEGDDPAKVAAVPGEMLTCGLAPRPEASASAGR